MAIDVGTATGYLDLDISGFIRGLQSANTEATKQSQTLESTLGSGLQTIGGKLEGAGKALTVGVTTPVVAMGTAAVKTSATFEAGMSQIQATMGITKDSMSTLNGESVNTMDALSSLAQEMGANTKFSATEAADAINILAMAGYDTDKIYGSLPNILNLAAAGGLEIADAADIATGVMAGFNLKAEDSSMVADKIATMASSAKGSVGEFGQAMATAAGQASVTGQSFDDTAVALEILGNHNLSAAEGGNALNRILKNLYQPTEQAAAAMEELGVSAYDADGKARALPDVLQDFQDKLGGLTDEEYNDIMGQIFDSATMKSVPFLINDCTAAWDTQDDTVTSLIEGIRGAGDAYGGIGAASGQAQAQMDNLEGQITLLKSALEGVAIQIGNILMPYITSFVEKIQGLVDWFANLDEGTQKTIVKLALLAAVVGPVLIGIGKLVSGVGGAIRGFNEIKGAFTAIKTGFSLLGSSAAGAGASIGAIAGPVLAVVAVIAVLVAAFKHLWDTNEEFRNKITGIWDGIKAKFEEFGQGITDRLNALGFDFDNFTQVVGAIWNGFCELLAPVFEGAFQIISAVFGTVLDVLTGLFDVFAGIFTGNWDMVWTGVKEIFAGLWNGIKGIFEGVLMAIEGIADTVLGWFGTSWEEVWTNIKQFFINIWNGIISFFSNVINAIKTAVSNFITTIINFFAQLPTNIANFITNAFNNVQTWAINMVNKAREMGTNFINTVVSFFTHLPGKVLQFITSAFDNVQTWVTNMVNKAREMGTNFINNVVSFMQQLPDKIKQHLDSAITNLATWVTDMGQKGTEAVQSLIDNVESAASDIVDKVKSIGSDIVSGVWNGLEEAKDTFVSNVKGFFSGIVDSVKDVLGIGSPSKVFRDEVGRWIPPGIVQGFDDAMPDAISDMEDSLNDGIDNMDVDNINVVADLQASFSAVVGWFESMEQRLANAVQGMRDELVALVQAGQMVVGADGSLSYVGYGGFRNSALSVSNSTGNSNGQVRSGGDTFIFNSPKAIDEIEAARQMEKTKRDMAEGF